MRVDLLLVRALPMRKSPFDEDVLPAAVPTMSASLGVLPSIVEESSAS